MTKRFETRMPAFCSCPCCPGPNTSCFSDGRPKAATSRPRRVKRIPPNSASYKMMREAALRERERLGLNFNPVHFSFETRLIGWLILGRFEVLDRDCLTPIEITILETLERQNAVLIGHQISYNQRKEILRAFADSLRATLPAPPRNEEAFSQSNW